jgi:hypothetical protein
MSNNYAAKIDNTPKLVPGQFPDEAPKKKKRRQRG